MWLPQESCISYNNFCITTILIRFIWPTKLNQIKLLIPIFQSCNMRCPLLGLSNDQKDLLPFFKISPVSKWEIKLFLVLHIQFWRGGQ
ncbi:hypothetical protein GDO81_015795 [Engystomops pustulosus]|uniref:Uncharacterized protein n=1 Tax=Engystomops pustulosus TaxID=76066 RepID=A0AAV7ARX6_ENGPU|nr:hypothetical protein GDO81_015795 [Engystomops pustulosus]